MTFTEWATLITIIGGQVVLIIQAWKNNTHAAERGTETLRQVTPPSNGHTLGQLAEAAVNATTVAAVEATRVRQVMTPHEPAVEPAIPSAEVPAPVQEAQTGSTPPPPPLPPNSEPPVAP